jgi:imidazolonepropionase-like amidohydrolase
MRTLYKHKRRHGAINLLRKFGSSLAIIVGSAVIGLTLPPVNRQDVEAQRAAATQIVPSAGSRTYAFMHVSVLPMNREMVLSDQTVVISEGRIIAVGPAKTTRVPIGALKIDGKGKYLLPGLWDMHVHMGNDEFDKTSHLRLFIANGVTGIRIMEGSSEFHSWRKEIESGTLVGPRMLIASSIIDGPKTYLPGVVIVRNGKEAREAVRMAKQEGADFVKVHDNLERAPYFELVDEAKRLGLPVEGHVPTSITAAEASQAGQKSIEHLTGLAVAEADKALGHLWFVLFKQNGTWQCPTLIMRHNYASLNDLGFANDWRLKYVKPSWRARWLRMTKEAQNWPADEAAKRKEIIRQEKALVANMQKAGVGILAGTDDANPYSFVGFSLHDELAMLVDAGLTPMQALQSATLNPAKFLNRLDSLGTIEKGKLADLVLLDANPLVNIRNTQRIKAVVVNGRYFDEDALKRILSDVETAASKN